MAKISQSSVTLELETLSCDEVGSGIVMLDITVEEAQELRKLLNERFNENTTSGPINFMTPTTTPINSTAEHDWELAYSNLYHKVADMIWRIHNDQERLTASELEYRWDKIRSQLPDPKV